MIAYWVRSRPTRGKIWLSEGNSEICRDMLIRLVTEAVIMWVAAFRKIGSWSGDCAQLAEFIPYFKDGERFEGEISVYEYMSVLRCCLVIFTFTSFT